MLPPMTAEGGRPHRPRPPATRETTTSTTTIIKSMIALPAMIKSMGVGVLVPHLAYCGFDVLLVVTTLSCTICKHADTRVFEHHRHANVHAFVLGQGRRDDGIFLKDNGARDDVHHGRFGADDVEGDAANIIC